MLNLKVKMGIKNSSFPLFIYALTFCIVNLVFISDSQAMNLEKLKIYFLSGDYKLAISEGEKLLAKRGGSSGGEDELYYLMGLSYLKDGNYLRASDIFEIILKEFKGSAFKDEARLGLADTYFLRGDYLQAQARYKDLIAGGSLDALLPIVYQRLSQCASRAGNIKEAQEYLVKARGVSPLGLDLPDAADCKLSDDFYTVQVGSFSREINAKSLVEKLKAQGYAAFIEEPTGSAQEKMYRVKVGKFSTRQEVEGAENKLIQDGYPTRVCP